MTSSQYAPRKRVWYRVYRHRMHHGLERCRECGTSERLTFDHIVPWSVRRSWRFDAVTILCLSCNREKANRTRPYVSLAYEEMFAPPERRWSLVGRDLYGIPTAEEWLAQRITRRVETEGGPDARRT